MAAEIVVWKNLLGTLESVVERLPPNHELRMLLQSVGMIEGALLAVEAGEQMDDNDATATRSKLGNLVALVHEADDLLDGICTSSRQRELARVTEGRNLGEKLRLGAALQRAVAAISTFTQEVSLLSTQNNQLALPNKVAENVKKISKGIEKIANELNRQFDPTRNPERRVERRSKPIKIEVQGRDKDKKNIIGKLLHPQPKSKTNVSVIPIVGSPGLGKSALARLVYEDEKVKNHFDLRMWIQVSGIHDEGEIIRETVETCKNRKSNYKESSQPTKMNPLKHHQNEILFRDLLGCRSFQRSLVTLKYTYGTSDPEMDRTSTSKNQMDIFERRLRKEIDGKLYLLVLDDACIKQWGRLKDILAGGAAGSKILVTTRSADVGVLSKLETDEIYPLEGLSSTASLSLFKILALPKDDSRDHELESIGESIVSSCKGVPLSIMVAGSHLYGKSKEEWLYFKNDLIYKGVPLTIRVSGNRLHGNSQNTRLSVKNDTMLSKESEEERVMLHILEHSYNDLPTRLKACFGYCSLFPHYFEFNKNDLISLWMAQGFVAPEHHGELYFLELARRNFFQDVVLDGLDNIVACKMHPLMRDLACTKAAGILNMYVADNSVGNSLDLTCKHVSFSCYTDSPMKRTPSLPQAQSLRTFVFLKEPDCDAKFDKFCNMLISKFKCLRVLDLHDLGIEELSDSIGRLIHLRYLDLSRNNLVTLPKSITGLYNLQTLKLNSCQKLTTFRGDFGELVSLKNFELDDCDSLNCMPLGLEKLTQLEMLSHLVIGKSFSQERPDIGLKALEKLDNLRGQLEIELTGDWKASIGEGSEAKLNCKSNLIELKIRWAQPIANIEKLSHLLLDKDKLPYQNLLENLQPNPNLKVLSIEGYKGSDFPSWARGDLLPSSLPNLVVVDIEGCDKCQHLPPFGKLPLLKRLTLRHMANVLFVESDELSAGTTEGASSASASFFQSLEELTLHNFDKLEAWRKELMLTSRHQSSIRYFPRLFNLRIWNCPKLTSMPLFPWVKNIDLRNVNQKLLQECGKKARGDIPQPQEYDGIKSLQIKRCVNLERLTAVRKGLRNLPGLKELVIDKCDALTSLASELQYLTSLRKLEISSCKKLDLSYDGDTNMDYRSMASWVSLRPFRNLTQKSAWESLKSLDSLTLKEIPNMKTLPEGLKYVKTLKFLWLSACDALTELPEWIGGLTMLQHLRIDSCPALKRLPNRIQEVRSLKKVEITDCTDLMERCREHTGKDWHKINHARILLHMSWRYGLMSDPGAAQNNSRSNVRTVDDVKYIIIPVIPADL